MEFSNHLIVMVNPNVSCFLRFPKPYPHGVHGPPGPPQPKACGAHGWRSAVRRSAGGSRGPEPWHRAAGEQRERMGMGEVGPFL